jgi:NAD(P)-dependent dehydrogenase (short-subunit alcohol dehydrogenase family)
MASFIYRLFVILSKGLVELNDPTESFAGRTVIVTGSNTGLGLAAAIKFANLGASRLILGVRSIEKGNAAKLTVEEQSKAKNPDCKIEVWQLDMLSYPSVKAFAARATSELPRLDVAVLNAGVSVSKFEKSEHGWETTLQVNTLSTLLLGLLLLPKLRASKTADYTPTLEIVGSGAHQTTEFDEKHRQAENLIESYNNAEALSGGIPGQIQYGRSKLFLMYADEGLARLATNKSTGKPDVFIVTVCPGPCTSDLGRNHQGFFISILKKIIPYFSRTAEQGSRTLVSGTLVGEKGHGQFWRDDLVQE